MTGGVDVGAVLPEGGDCLGTGGHAKFADHCGHMKLHGGLADAEFARDGFV
jgi:hypothetical protein